jgi:hypothetical protein
MKQTLRSSAAALLLLLGLLAFNPSSALAAPDQSSTTVQAPTALTYKVISGFKQPFNDELQDHLSKGWTPVGGVSVTVWNNDLYFAQLISKPL